MTSKCHHEQYEQVGPDRCYTGSVAIHPYTEENRAAHGGITYTEQCQSCGARRSVNANGSHAEEGPWGPTREQRRAEASRLHALARTLAEAAQAVRVVARTDSGRELAVTIDSEGYICATGSPHTRGDVLQVLSTQPGVLEQAQAIRRAHEAAHEADAAV